MENIQINDGTIRLTVNGDPNRVIAFDPTDIIFAEKFYKTFGEFETKLTEFQRRSQDLEAETERDDNDLPANMEARLALLHETCDFIREKIDNLFGKGTSQTAFGDALNLNCFSQFFDQIAPFFQKTRAAKLEPYISKARNAKPAMRAKRKRK